MITAPTADILLPVRSRTDLILSYHPLYLSTPLNRSNYVTHLDKFCLYNLDCTSQKASLTTVILYCFRVN
jgi:hypothetical protein